MQNIRRFSKEVWVALKQTFGAYGDIDPFNKSIVIAWYTIFSLPGLLVIIINIAGYFFGTEAVTGQITGQVGGMIGGDTASEMERIIANGGTSCGCAVEAMTFERSMMFSCSFSRRRSKKRYLRRVSSGCSRSCRGWHTARWCWCWCFNRQENGQAES